MTAEERKLRFIDAYVAAHLAARPNNGFLSDDFSSDVNHAMDLGQRAWEVYREVEYKQLESQHIITRYIGD